MPDMTTTGRSSWLSWLGTLVLIFVLSIELATHHRAQMLLSRHLNLARRAGIPSHVRKQLERDSQAALVQHMQQALVATLLLLLVFRRTVVRQEKEIDRLRVMEKRAYELTENMPAGAYVLTLNRKSDGEIDLEFRFASTRFLEIFGVTREALLNDANIVLKSIHPDDRASMNAANALALGTGDPFRWEGRLIVNGCTRWYAISSNPRQAPDGATVWEGVVTDITDRIEAQQELERSVQREIQAEQQRCALLEQKLKTSLTAAAAVHELQQPLAAILLNARIASHALAAMPLASRPTTVERQLEALAADGDHAVAAMERVRLLLRNVETRPSPVDIANCVDSALLQMNQMLRQHQIGVETAGIDQPCILLGDGAQIQIALINLIRNAIQAMEEKNPTCRALQIALHQRSEYVRIQVADSGPGFPADYRHETHRDLFQSTKTNGMGLGLFLVKTAALNHGGQLRVGRSTRLGGAEVSLVLPQTAQARDNLECSPGTAIDNDITGPARPAGADRAGNLRQIFSNIKTA